jgi:hypothetical protein
MKIKQLSLFIENKPGALSAPCRILADAGINIATLCLADTQDFGILRLIVEKWQEAKDILESKQFVVKMTDVVAVEVDDSPGGLTKILASLEKDSLDVEYMYAFTCGNNDKAILVFRFEKPDKAIKALSARKINVLTPAHVFK